MESVPNGWWYTSLVPGGRRVFMYLTDADLAPQGITRGVNVFCADGANRMHWACFQGVSLQS